MKRIFKNIIKQAMVFAACAVLVACGARNKEDLEYMQSELVKPLQYTDSIDPISSEESFVIPDLPSPKQTLNGESLKELIRPPSLLGPLDLGKKPADKKDDKS